MDAFGVDERDLAANARGRLGDRQVALLRRGAWRSMATMAALVVGTGGLVLATAVRPIAWWRWALIGTLAALALLAGAARARQLLRAVRSGRVSRHRGPVARTMQLRVGWWLHVDGRRFHLPVRFWHVMPGMDYDVFVADAAELVVAMAPIAPIVDAELLRVWAVRLAGIEATDSAAVLAALGADDPPDGFAHIEVGESRGAFFVLRSVLDRSTITRARLDATFGPGNPLPRLHPGAPQRVSYHVAVDGSPWTVDVVGVFVASPADPSALATGVDLLRQAAT